MQGVKEKAIQLLKDQTVDRVIGWRAGEFFYDLTPSTFTSAEDVEQNFVWSVFSGANLSKYLIAESRKGGKAAGMKLVNALKMSTIAVSLGDAETLVQHPASMTHSAYSSEELKEAGIPEGLVRISVGLENPEDCGAFFIRHCLCRISVGLENPEGIIADFQQAFAQL